MDNPCCSCKLTRARLAQYSCKRDRKECKAACKSADWQKGIGASIGDPFDDGAPKHFEKKRLCKKYCREAFKSCKDSCKEDEEDAPARRRLADGKVMAKTVDLMFTYLEKGKLETDICIGKQEHCDDEDYMKAIPATITLTLPDPEEPTITATAPFVLSGALVYLMLGAVGIDVEDFFEKPWANAIGELGLADVTISLGYNIEMKVIKFKLSGSPELGNDCDNWFTCRLEQLGESITFVIDVEVQLDSSPLEAEIKFSIKTEPTYFGRHENENGVEVINTADDDWKCALKDSKGFGPSIYIAATAWVPAPSARVLSFCCIPLCLY